jgi:diaminohydroxyphosphoribosylaminopyrimidine deaminase/5-amino-6-(5-phosphoribosylamino)uracil reductase
VKDRISDARFSEADRRFMAQAMRLAEQGRGATNPNPVVGAVLVKNGKVIARGFHRRAGLPHAEIEALAQLGMRAPGATLYVTLEPCCHHGRTGPCTEKILASGIRRIVVGCCDENPLVSGRGIAILKRAGLRVDAGCLKDECRRQNRAFFSWVKNKRPFVTMKVAATLDGCIGDRQEKGRQGRERWITGSRSRHAAHALRAQHDAILVGVGTILADDPKLTVRLPGVAGKMRRGTLRVVLDSQLRTPPTAALLAQARAKAPLIVATRPRKPGASPEDPILGLPRGSANSKPLAPRSGSPPRRATAALSCPRCCASWRRVKCNPCWSRVAARSTAPSSARAWWIRWRYFSRRAL